MQKWIKIEFGYPPEPLLLVCDFLYKIAKVNKKEFYAAEVRSHHQLLMDSGDRYLRHLREKDLIKFIVPCKRKKTHILKSDIFDIQRAKNIINAGGYYKELEEAPLFVQGEMELI